VLYFISSEKVLISSTVQFRVTAEFFVRIKTEEFGETTPLKEKR
jgi:hypothetical protein